MAIKDHKPKYIPGDHLVVCERTGRVIRVSDARKEWNGRWVHKDWYEPKHPALVTHPVPTDKIAARQPVRANDGSPVCNPVFEWDVFEIDVFVAC